MIVVEGVAHRFGSRTVLDGVDMRFANRRTAVIGPNGSGKSTLARLLNGLVVPTRGTVRVDGLDTRADGAKVRERVGFVFQDPDAQIVMPTVEEDVAFGLRGRALDDAERTRRVRDALERVGLAGFEDHPAHLLSGGEKQLLAICSALVREPGYLVLDEPTTLLDHRNTRQVAELIDGLEQTIVLVTHDLELARGYERVVVLDEGRVIADGEPSDAIEAYLAVVR